MSTNSNNSNKSVVILIILLILSGIIMIIMQTSHSSTKKELTTQIDTLSQLRDNAIAELNAKLEQIKQLEALNDELKKKIGFNAATINSLKKQIAELLKVGGSKGDLEKANSKISELEAMIANLNAELAKLRAENEGLINDKSVLTSTNKELLVRVDTLKETNVVLKQKIDMASILIPGDAAVVGVKVDGGEESEINKINKMNVLRVKFNVIENRVVESGNYDFYLVIKDPEDKLLVDPSITEDTKKVTLADGQEVVVSAKITTDINQGQRRFVKFDYRGAEKFKVGVYTVTIYQRGYKVGQASGTFRKGFLGIF